MNPALPGGRRAVSGHGRLRASLPIAVGSSPTPSSKLAVSGCQLPFLKWSQNKPIAPLLLCSVCVCDCRWTWVK